MRGTRDSFAISQSMQTCRILTIPVPDSHEAFVTASSSHLSETSVPIRHPAGLAPVTYLFTAIAFHHRWFRYAKRSVQGVAWIFSKGFKPFMLKSRWQAHRSRSAWGPERGAASPELALPAAGQPSGNFALFSTGIVQPGLTTLRVGK